MSNQLPHQGPDKGECQGDRDRCKRPECPAFGTLGRPGRDGKRRVRGCDDPSARGKRNRTKGQRTQRKIANKLGIPTGMGGGNEETWQSNLRIEVKSGAQVRPVITAYLKQKAQSEAARPIGDNRPFVAICVHENVELIVFEIDQKNNVLHALGEP
jgi:hypothetical protein